MNRQANRNENLDGQLKQLKSILDILTDPTSFVGKDYVYRYVNNAYCDYYGKSKDEILGHKVWEFIGEDAFKENIKGHFDQCLKGKEVRYANTVRKAANGEIVHLLMHYIPHYDEHGVIDGLVSTARDISKEKGLKRDWEKTLMALDDVLIVLDKEFNILDINQKGINILGCVKDRIVGKKCYELFHETDCPVDFCPLLSSRETGQPESSTHYN